MRRSSSYVRHSDLKSLSSTQSTTRKRNASTSSMWSQLQPQFNSDYLCDRTVVFADTNRLCNIVSVELAEKSLFFQKLLRYHTCKSDIFLPEFLYPAFPNILEFIRCGRTNIDVDNAYDIFVAADYLQMDTLKQISALFLKKWAKDPAVSIQLWLNTRNLVWPEIGPMAYNKLLMHFDRAWLSQEFLELTFPDILKILQDENLRVNYEKDVLQAALRWISHAPITRLPQAEQLLTCCRLGLLSEQELHELQNKVLFESFPEFNKVLQKWPACLFQDPKNVLLMNNIVRIVTPRQPQEVVLVLGGWAEQQGPKSAVQVYDRSGDHWTLWSGDVDSHNNTEGHSNPLGNMPRRVYAGCVVVKHCIYIVGGFDGNQAQKSTLCFDIVKQDGWKEISCMYDKRYYVSVAHACGFIYAMGGHNGDNDNQRLRSAERFSITDNVWRPIAAMNLTRSDAAAAELHGRVYIAGGFDGREYHRTAEYYSPIADSWILISSMQISRGGVSLARHDNYIYAIGGNNGNRRVSEIERYDPISDSWQVAGNMNTRKSNLSSTVIGEEIYIIGGWSDEPNTGILDIVEKFNVKTGVCSNVKPLQFPASATCACTIRGRDVVRHFVHRDLQQLVNRSLERQCLMNNSAVAAATAATGTAGTATTVAAPEQK